MNKKNRKIQLEKLIKEAELKKLIAQVEEQQNANGDDNQASEGKGKKFTDAIIDAFKIPGLED